MSDLLFTSKLSWSGGRSSSGVVETGGQSLQLSVPASMGGLGAGTSPEELISSAVGSCYTSTLAAILESRRLPAASIEVQVNTLVSDYPGPNARVARLTRLARDASSASIWLPMSVIGSERWHLPRQRFPRAMFSTSAPCHLHVATT